MFTSVSRGVNGVFPSVLQCARCESITAIKCQVQSHKQTCVHIERVFCNAERIFNIFAPCIMSSASSLKRNMNKNKFKKIQVLSALLEGRSEEQLQQESSQTREKKELADTDRGSWFEQERQCLMNFLQFQKT